MQTLSTIGWEYYPGVQGQRDPEKGPAVGAKLRLTRKSVNLTRNMTQSWVDMTPLSGLQKANPELSTMTIMGHFPGHADPGLFI